jgi:hypothetical protein
MPFIRGSIYAHVVVGSLLISAPLKSIDVTCYTSMFEHVVLYLYMNCCYFMNLSSGRRCWNECSSSDI